MAAANSGLATKAVKHAKGEWEGSLIQRNGGGSGFRFKRTNGDPAGGGETRAGEG
jgi:hypothetical protein